MGRNLLLNVDDFVRVTQVAAETIEGRYDNVDYVFPYGEPVDIHKAVAVHIFGFGLPDVSDDPKQQDKLPALLRLGWVSTSGDRRQGLVDLKTKIKFEEIPPFPTLLRLSREEENTGQMQVEESMASRVPSSPSSMGSGAAPETAGPTDQQARKTLTLNKAKA